MSAPPPESKVRPVEREPRAQHDARESDLLVARALAVDFDRETAGRKLAQPVRPRSHPNVCSSYSSIDATHESHKMAIMRIGRRTFIGGSLAASVGGWAGRTPRLRAADVGQDGGGPIIDTHLHVWDLERFRLPWLDRAGERLNRSYAVSDYAKAVVGLNVTKAVYVEVAVRPEQREAEADYVVELCTAKSGPVAAAVIGGNPAADGFAAYVRRFKGSPVVKGVRASYVRGAVEDKRFVDGIRLLGELGMSFDLLMGSDLLDEAAKLVAACPRTRFVLDHCGNPDVKWYAAPNAEDAKARAARERWEQGVGRLADKPNVVCKISGVAESGEDAKVTADVVRPVVNHCLDRFGGDRVIFASNWPVCLKTITLKGWVEVVRQVVAPRGADFERRLFAGNATRVYGL
jgi:predicted TIM-barrel fold metal-dependent hydrolase